jgi:hypothetical protein
MKNKLILVILLCLLCLTSISNAETLTGVLGGSASTSETYNLGGVDGGSAGVMPAGLKVVDIEKVSGATALIRFDSTGTHGIYTGVPTSGESTPYTAYLLGESSLVVRVSGTVGYFRTFDNTGDEKEGYQWITFNNWNITGLTGTKDLMFCWTASNLKGMQFGTGDMHSQNPATGQIGFEISNQQTVGQGGNHLLNKQETIYSEYTLTKPSGLGISGTISKTVNGVLYPSKIYVMNGTSPYTNLGSDNTITSYNIPVNTNAQTIKISMQTPTSIWYNSSVLFTPTVTPTPTPTPVVSPYTIELSADYSNYNEPITGTLLYNGVAATATNTRAVDWIYRDASLAQDTDGEYTNNINYVENGNTTKHLNYGWNGTKFVGWDTANGGAFSNDKGTSLPNALSLYTLLSGSVTVQCMVYPVGGGAPSIVTHPLTVGGTGSMFNIVIHAVDWQSGSIIGGSTISVQEKLTNTWSNVTTGDDGYRSIKYPMGTPLKIVASATGYVSDFLNYNVQGNDFVNIQLYKIGTEETNISLSTLLVRTFVRNDLGQIQPLSGVTVSLSDGQVKTSTAGAAQFTVTNGTLINIDAFKTGYVSATKTVTPTTSLTTATLYLYSTSSTFVPTPFPTATPTIRPTEALRGNLTTCQAVLPAGADVMDIMQNNIACWGIDDLEGQNFTMAALIILICAMVLGKFGKGDGAAIGAIIGFVISYARHLIPFYILIIAIALIAAYFAQKFFGSK